MTLVNIINYKARYPDRQASLSSNHRYACVNFIATQFNVRQTTQFDVSQAKLAGFIRDTISCVASPLLFHPYSYVIKCVNFIATQFNVSQTTQFNVSQAKLAGFIAIQFNVSLPLYSYKVRVLTTGKKKKIEIVLEGSFGTF